MYVIYDDRKEKDPKVATYSVNIKIPHHSDIWTRSGEHQLRPAAPQREEPAQKHRNRS